MPSVAEDPSERKDVQCCFSKRKSTKILEASLLTLSIIVVMALFSIPVVFVVVVEVRLPGMNMRTGESRHVP